MIRHHSGLTVFAAIISAAALSGVVSAHITGPPDERAGDPPLNATCRSALCHGSYPLNSGDGTLTIQGLPANYAPGVAYPLRVVITDPGPTRWGFEATAIRPASGLQAGTFAPVDTHLVQVSEGPGTRRDYIKHKEAGTFKGQPNGASWNILWMAPTAGSGPVHFYLAGNAANADSTPNFDYIYTYNVEIGELATGGVATNAEGSAGWLQMYPNPSVSGTTIQLRLPAALSCRLTMVDPSGRQVRRFPIDSVGAGETNVFWDGRDDLGHPVAPGVYYCVLVAGTERHSERFVVIR